MSTYTKRLVGPRALANSSLTAIYTVPAGRSAVIRNLNLINNSTTLTHVVRFGIGGTTNAQRVMRFNVGPESTTYWETRIAMAAGEELYGYCDTVGSVTATVTGYEFEA